MAGVEGRRALGAVGYIGHEPRGCSEDMPSWEPLRKNFNPKKGAVMSRGKTVASAAAIAACALVCAGCLSAPGGAADAAASGMTKYYDQDNSAEILHVEGTNVCISLTGATKLVLSTPVPPKNMMPRDPSWLDSLMDGAKSIAPWAVVGYLGAHGSYTPTPSIRGSTTINTAPAATTTP